MSGSLRRLALTNGGEPPLGMSVRCATTASVTIATAFNAGDVIDGVTLANGDLVLDKDNSTAALRGVYMVGPTPVRWRAFDRYNDYPGRLFSVEEGTANAGTLWLCTSSRGGTLGTTAIAFARLPNTTAAGFSAYLDGILTGEANDDFFRRSGGFWTSRTPAQALTSLGYEVGTFTPTMAFATPGTSSWAYTTQSGLYWKFGTLVWVSINLNATPTIGTGTGAVRIDGLPVTPNASGVGLLVHELNANWTWPASRTQVNAFTTTGQTYLQLRSQGSALSPASLTQANMTDGNAHTLRIDGTYRVA
jgi:hypothetical protein